MLWTSAVALGLPDLAGKATLTPASLALKLLRTVPGTLLTLKTKRKASLHADGRFERAGFIQGVLAKGLDIVIGVRCSRKLEDGRSVREALTRGLHRPMTMSWVCGQASSRASVLPEKAVPQRGAGTTICDVKPRPGR